MQIWIAVTETLLCISLVVLIVLETGLWKRFEAMIGELQRATDDFSDSEKSALQARGLELTRIVDAQKALVSQAELSGKANADRLETAIRDLAGVARGLAESWRQLAGEIKSQATYRRSADALTERQVAAIEFLGKLSRTMSGLVRRRGDLGFQAPTDEQAAEIEKMTEEEQRIFAGAITGLDRETGEEPL